MEQSQQVLFYIMFSPVTALNDILVCTDHHTTRHCFIVQRYCLVRTSSTACANNSVDLTTAFYEWTEQRGHSRTSSGFAESRWIKAKPMYH